MENRRTTTATQIESKRKRMGNRKTLTKQNKSIYLLQLINWIRIRMVTTRLNRYFQPILLCLWCAASIFLTIQRAHHSSTKWFVLISRTIEFTIQHTMHQHFLHSNSNNNDGHSRKINGYQINRWHFWPLCTITECIENRLLVMRVHFFVVPPSK